MSQPGKPAQLLSHTVKFPDISTRDPACPASDFNFLPWLSPEGKPDNLWGTGAPLCVCSHPHILIAVGQQFLLFPGLTELGGGFIGVVIDHQPENSVTQGFTFPNSNVPNITLLEALTAVHWQRQHAM